MRYIVKMNVEAVFDNTNGCILLIGYSKCEVQEFSVYIDDPGERIAKLRRFIRIYTESPLQTQWHMNYLCANTRDEVSLYLSFN